MFPDPRWNFAEPLFGLNSTGDGFDLPAGMTLDSLHLEPAPSPDGDILILRVPEREVRSMEVRMSQAQPFDSLVVRHFDPAPIKTGELVMVSDCQARAFFQVTNYVAATGEIAHAKVGPTDGGATGIDLPGNRSSTLVHPFKIGATVVPLTTLVYYLAPSRDDAQRMSLYRKMGGAARSDEIAEGIERLEFQFGIDKDPVDARVDTYVGAQDVTDWNAVMTVQVALLARAPDEFGTDRDEQTYVLLSSPEVVQAGPFNDRNLRKVFSATLALRNQVID